MEHPGDVIEENSAGELFSLASIGGRDLKRLEREEARLIAETGHSASDLLVLNEEKALKRRLLRKRADDFRRAVEGGEYLHFDRNAEHEIDLGALESTRPINPQGRDDLYLSSSDDEDTRENLVFESDDDGDNSGSLESDDDSFGGGRIDDDMYAEALANADSLKTKNHVSLLTDLDPEDEETKKSRKIESWCHSAELKRLMDADESGDEEDVKWQDNAKVGIRKRVSFADDPSSPVRKNKTDESQPDVPSSDEEEVHPLVTKRQKRMRRLRRPLTAEERALATKLIQSAKSRRDLLEWNFHRYRFFEDESSLPEWFAEDERKHMRKAPPVEDTTGLATRPIQGKTLKKAEEAKARKRIKLSKRLSSVRKRAENLPDDLTEREAWSKIKSMYKNAGLLKKKRRPTNYVVNTKDGARNTSRTAPRGAKVKLVDRRMKSDLRGQAKTSAKRGRKGNAGKRRDKRAKRRGAQ
uniref:Spb1_C domain-containing protein n=1 Tax=Mesocestoides corti TaxID=53468 RepID=A0A5K3FZU3_MESCO